jgi:hypothetical protein
MFCVLLSGVNFITGTIKRKFVKLFEALFVSFCDNDNLDMKLVMFY